MTLILETAVDVPQKRFLQRWRAVELIWDTHRMGEPKMPVKTALARASEDAMVVQTMGGRVYVR